MNSLWELFPSGIDLCVQHLWPLLDNQSMMRCLTTSRGTNYAWQHDDVLKRRSRWFPRSDRCGWCVTHGVFCYHEALRPRQTLYNFETRSYVLPSTRPLNRYQFQGLILDRYDQINSGADHVSTLLGELADDWDDTHSDPYHPEDVDTSNPFDDCGGRVEMDTFKPVLDDIELNAWEMDKELCRLKRQNARQRTALKAMEARFKAYVARQRRPRRRLQRLL